MQPAARGTVDLVMALTPHELASSTRRMTEQERDPRVILGKGPRGRVVIVVCAIIVIGVALYLLLA
jgi:hypothetical protein